MRPVLYLHFNSSETLTHTDSSLNLCSDDFVHGEHRYSLSHPFAIIAHDARAIPVYSAVEAIGELGLPTAPPLVLSHARPTAQHCCGVRDGIGPCVLAAHSRGAGFRCVRSEDSAG